MNVTVESLAFTCDGHRYRGERRTDETALHSGRPLYHVRCETCGVTVHSGTTSTDPDYWIRCHEAV